MTVDELFNAMRDAVDADIDDQGDDLTEGDFLDINDLIQEVLHDAIEDLG